MRCRVLRSHTTSANGLLWPGPGWAGAVGSSLAIASSDGFAQTLGRNAALVNALDKAARVVRYAVVTLSNDKLPADRSPFPWSSTIHSRCRCRRLRLGRC